MFLKKEINEDGILNNKYVSSKDINELSCFLHFYDFTNENTGIYEYFIDGSVGQESFDYEIHNNTLILRTTKDLSDFPRHIPLISVFTIVDYSMLILEKTYAFKYPENCDSQFEDDLNYFYNELYNFNLLPFEYFRDDILNGKEENDYIKMTTNNREEGYVVKTTKEINKYKKQILKR